MMGYYENGWGGGVGVAMMAMMFLFMAGIIAVIVYAIRSASHGEWNNAPRVPAADGALAVLRERYARGEIDHEDYEQRQVQLLKNPRI